MRIATFTINAAQRLFVEMNEGTNEIEFQFFRVFGEDGGRGLEAYGIPTGALRMLGFCIESESLQPPLALRRGRELLVVPRLPRSGLTLLFLEGTTLVRAAYLGRKDRKRLVTAIEQARAAVRDPSLAEEILSRHEARK